MELYGVIEKQMGNTASQMEFGPAPRVTVLSKVPHSFIHGPSRRGSRRLILATAQYLVATGSFSVLAHDPFCLRGKLSLLQGQHHFYTSTSFHFDFLKLEFRSLLLWKSSQRSVTYTSNEEGFVLLFKVAKQSSVD